MKGFKFLMLLLTGMVFLTACQKEFTIEATTAKGLLQKDSTGDCMPALVNGVYAKDSLLKASNYADITVKITQTGSYSIKTDTVNGYSFSAVGEVGIIGLNTIRLIGKGRPFAGGVDVFKIKFDSSICEFNVVVSGPGGGGTSAAVFTLAGSPSVCTGATQTSNFYASVPTTSANTVTVFANVTQGGTYTINAVTSPANGLTFSRTGTLAVGINQPITLIANGTPGTAGSIPYTLSTTAPASNCGFNLTVQAAAPPATFTFDCSAPSYTGTYQEGVSTLGNTVTISVTSVAGGSYNITSAGTASNNGVTFSGTGVLSASASPQTVTLFASGTPMAAGLFTYTLTGAGSTGTCSISQTYSAAPPVVSDSITAYINGVYTTFNDTPVALSITNMGVNLLTINGFSTSQTSDDAISIGVSTNGPVTPGSYNVNTMPLPTVIGSYTDPTGTNIYNTFYMGIPQINPLTIFIQSISTTRTKGTFSGRIYANNGSGPGFITITNGFFDVPVF